MIKKHLIELMNREIDGVNSPDESATLQAYLQSNEEGRRYYEGLRGVATLFSTAGDVTPPGDLNRMIMASIPERDARRGAHTERRSMLDAFSPRRKLAYSFAAGLVLGCVLFLILFNALPRQDSLDRKDVYGALIGRRDGGTVIATEHAILETANVSGSVSVEYRERSVAVICDLNGIGELETTLTPAMNLPVEGVRAPSCGAFDVRTSSGGVMLRTPGLCGIIVIFADETGAHPAVNVSIDSGGIRLFEQTIARGETRDSRR